MILLIKPAANVNRLGDKHGPHSCAVAYRGPQVQPEVVFRRCGVRRFPEELHRMSWGSGFAKSYMLLDRAAMVKSGKVSQEMRKNRSFIKG